VIAAVIVIPAKLGGYGAIFAKVPAAEADLTRADRIEPRGLQRIFHARIRLGARAVSLPPFHDGDLELLGRQCDPAQCRAAPGLFFCAWVDRAARLHGDRSRRRPEPCAPAHAAGFARYGSNYAVPALFLESFDSWFMGIAFAGMAIGALVPVAIMSIVCANLFTRNLYKEFLSPDCSQAQEANMAKIVSLVVKVGAVVFILALPQDYAIQLQLLGGIWIIQLLPAILLGLYTRWRNASAFLVGWLGRGACNRHLHGRDPRIRHLGLSLVSVFGVTLPG
jgi:solute:Na+ symporter, SSS family